MILVRDVFQAKYGQGGALVALFKEVREKWPESAQYAYRILTDASGPFFTIVTETEVAPYRRNLLPPPVRRMVCSDDALGRVWPA
jgi:hypothetical protein